MTASLATSEGWNCKDVPLMPSQRVALLAVMAKGLWGMMTTNSRRMEAMSIPFPAHRKRW